MTKWQELIDLAPRPCAPGPDSLQGPCLLRMTAQAGGGKGRYTHGPRLTLALWDDEPVPVAVWYFCGLAWAAEKRSANKGSVKKIKHPKHSDYDAESITVNYWMVSRYSKGFTQANSTVRSCNNIRMTPRERSLLLQYLGFYGVPLPADAPWYCGKLLNTAMHETARRRTAARTAAQHTIAHREIKDLPPLPQDFETTIRESFAAREFLWFTNEARHETDCAGVRRTVKYQRFHCDACEGDYIDDALYSHGSVAQCARCGRVMTLRNTRIGAKNQSFYRTYMWATEVDGALWLQRCLLAFNFSARRLQLTMRDGSAWKITTGAHPKRLCWRRDYNNILRPAAADGLEGAWTVSTGLYGASEYIAVAENVRPLLAQYLGMPWAVDSNPILSEQDICGLAAAMNRMPMLESLVKTGWGGAVLATLHHRTPAGIDLAAKTYYGVFGLNRAELAVVIGRKKHKPSFDDIGTVHRWKELGLAVTPANLRMVGGLGYAAPEVMKQCGRFGTGKVLKYLRQETRRTGKGDGLVIDRSITGDWLDYLRMAEKAGMNMAIEPVQMPLQLKRRHDEMVQRIRQIDAQNSMKANQPQNSARAAALGKKFPKIKRVLKRIAKLYGYTADGYSIIVPGSAMEIVEDSSFLSHCVASSDRYFERISTEESYILFLRKADAPQTPWYTLEVEPGGTVRQKRSYSNDQYADLDAALPFLAQWQAEIQRRMDEKERRRAAQSKQARLQEFAELQASDTRINRGKQQGQSLAAVLMADLLEAAPTEADAAGLG